MDVEFKSLEPYWDKYVVWCKQSGGYPDMGDFFVWLDDIDVVI